MAKRRKKLTPLQLEYRKQVYRLRREENRLLKMGASLPSRTSLELPKRVTKQAIQRLKSVKPKSIRKKAEFTTRKGEVVTYEKWIEILKKEKEERFDADPEPIDWETEANILIDNFWDQINSLPKGIAGVFGVWFMQVIYEHGKFAIAYWLKSMSPDLAEKWQSTGYDYKATMSLMDTEILNVLGSDDYKRAMEYMDRSDYAEWDV